MDAPDYQDKIDAVLSDGKYKLLDQDPTKGHEKSVTKALRGLEKEGELPGQLSKRLLPAHTSAPQMYGLPKIHKEGVPLRPIVSTIGSQPCQGTVPEPLTTCGGNGLTHQELSTLCTTYPRHQTRRQRPVGQLRRHQSLHLRSQLTMP